MLTPRAEWFPASSGALAQVTDEEDGSGRPPVMADVARRAGVSQMTVSRVLNNHPGVRPATRAKVLAAVADLDYRPNTAARALVTGRTRVLGVVSVNTALFGPASMLVAIERAAREAGYFVSIVSLSSPDRRALGDAIAHLGSQAAEGIIVIAPYAVTTAALRHLPDNLPIVAVEGGKAPVPTVVVDQYLGARRATRYLLSLGHPTVVHIAGPEDWHEARERERGWRETLATEGREAPPVVRGDWSPQSGYEAALSLAPMPESSALFVGNDQMAVGVLRALHEAGVMVPDQVSVVGFDDVPEAAYFSPPLTTIRQNFAEVGRRSLGLLLQQVEGSPRPRTRVVIPPDLVVRDSTAPPSSRRRGGDAPLSLNTRSP